jgi:GntR family transcriptional repressor for pyruvate dehydrogenase complex
MATGVRSSADYLTDAILALIRERGRKPGDRLPSVDELAASYGVASPTVREVLRRLEATGAVEIRHGSGTYLRRTVQPLIVANPHAEAVDETTVRNLLQARLLIEPELAVLAARSLTQEGRDLLDASLARASTGLASGPQGVQVGGLGVHRVIARLSGNQILADVIDSLLDVYAGEQLQIQRLYGSPDRDVAVHAQLIVAIEAGDADAAAARMRDHLLDVQATVLRRLAAGDDGDRDLDPGSSA